VWLGFSAAFIGIFYAVVKFLTMFRLRHLGENLHKVQHEVQKAQQRLESLTEKLKLEQSKKRTLERETAELRKTTQQLYARLQAVLPAALHPQLERCRTLYVEPVGDEFKLLHELDLVDEISKALGPFSLLVLQFPGDEEIDSTIAIGQLTQELVDGGVHYRGPEEGVFICFFAQPATAVDFLRQFVQEAPAEQVAAVRGGLHSGVEITEEKGEITHLLVHSLQRARQLLERAPAGTLVISAEAYQSLEVKDGIRSFDEEAQLYALSWLQEREGEDP